MKKLLFILISLCFSTGIFAQTITDSLVLYYPFSGNTNDWSGNAFDGINGGAILTSDHNGIANSAYSFDGIDDYIDLPNDSSLHPDFPFTLAAWMYMDPTSGDFAALCTEYNLPSTYEYDGASIGRYGTSKFNSGIYNGGSIGTSSRVNYVSNVTFTTNTWYYVVAVFEGLNNRKLYINCIEDENCTYTGTGSSYSRNYNLHGSIGRFYSGNAVNKTKGFIDEVAMWNRALDSDEITQLCTTDLWQIIQASTAEDNLEIFSVYPNPMINEAIINFNNPTQENHQIIIRNINGQEVQSYNNITSSSCVITKGSLAAGVYILELRNTITKAQINQKIIIQ
jgi:Concanavalin A-like lectin/glucanases superfamily/Secretion system C-terminal sorting domain